MSAGERPILAVDVDGVISLFGGDESEAAPGTTGFELIDGMVHRISLAAGDYLRSLSAHYDLVWATGWEARANEHLSPLLGLPQLPYLNFDGSARFGSADWKLQPLEDYCGERPLAWVDDSFDESCEEWAKARPAPTVLAPTESHRGLGEKEAELLRFWALSLPRDA